MNSHEKEKEHPHNVEHHACDRRNASESETTK